jgi:hypothetical protein
MTAGHKFIERALETSATTGTGAYTLAGAVTGHQAISGIGDGSTAHFAAWEVDTNGVPSGGWEVFIGTYASSGNTLARTQVLTSSNGNAAVSWSAGTRRIAQTLPAEVFRRTSHAASRSLALLSDSNTKTTTQPNGDYFVAFPGAGAEVELINLASGSQGILTAIQLSLNGGAGSFDCRLRIYVDQEVSPGFDVDLGTLFCSHLDAHTDAGQSVGTDHIQSQVVGTNTHLQFTTATSMVSYQMQFPVPYSDGVRVTIYTPASGVTIPLTTSLFSMVHRREGAVSSLRLRSVGHTRLDANAAAANAAASDIELFDVTQKAGWMVWWSMACFGASDYTYLERPYRYYIDGELSESFLNTGGEEYGATGWYFGAATRYAQPAVLLTATNNSNYTTVVGLDLLKMHGGIKFNSELRMVWGNKASYAASTDHKMGWCALYYQDTSVSVGGARTIAVPAASLTLTAYAPTVNTGSGNTIAVPAASLTLTAYAPTVTSGGGSTIADNFNRANASTLGSTSTGSRTWSVAGSGAGTPEGGIDTNRAYTYATSAAATTYAYIATDSADIDVSITLAVIGSDPIFAGLIARFVDADNMVLLQYDSATSGATAYSAYKKVGGSYTLLGSSTAITPTAGDVLRLKVTGTNTVDFYINGTHFGPFTATSISSSSVNAGFQSGSVLPGSVVQSTARFDDFLVA